MRILPAIDLRHGRCVRLLHGESAAESRYGDDPVAVARRWESEGASWLHVVDLDAAFGEEPQSDLVSAILDNAGIPVQVGGGIRRLEDFLRWRERGADRVVFGTVAIERPEVVSRALEEDASAVVVGVDVKNGRVAVRGWTETAGMDPFELGRKWASAGVERFVYTEVSRDGALTGVDAEATGRFARAVRRKVIASGGVASLEDLKSLKAIEGSGLEGVIVGRALYEGRFRLEEALRAAREDAG